MDYLSQLYSWLEQYLGIGPSFQHKVFNTLVTVVLLWLIYRLVHIFVFRKIADTRQLYLWNKTFTYILVGVGVIAVSLVWLNDLQSAATYLGLLSAGLAVALKDPISDMIGWIFIITRRPFDVGDRIQIGEFAGDVIDVRLFKFTLMEIGNWVAADQSTGRILHLPNHLIFTSVLANYTKGSEYIWNEIPVLITFESDWNKAKMMLESISEAHTKEFLQIAEESFSKAARQYMLQYGKLTSAVYTSVKDSGVLLTIRYLCEPRQRRNSTQAIWEDILRDFKRHADIDFAYPTQRFYNYLTEYKQAQGNMPGNEENLSR